MQKFDIPYIALTERLRPIKNELLTAIEQVLDSGQFILGQELSRFEQEFASLVETDHAIGVANGSDSLFLILQALGIGKGDEVITTSQSFVATAAMINNVGAKPIFIDITDDLNMDLSKIEAAVTPRTKAIMPVHLAGRPVDMTALAEIADRHRLHIIEDAAQAVGARWRGRPVGTFGVANGFSFHPLKNLHAIGDGGMITTNDAELARYFRKARNHGLENRDQCDFWSFNSRLDEIQAAVLRVLLTHLASATERRRLLAKRYCEALKPYVTVPEEKEGELHVYHSFVVQADERDALQEHLSKNGVQALVHYPTPLHMQPVARDLGYDKSSFPVAFNASKRILSLPIYPELEDAQHARIVTLISEFYEGRSSCV